MFLEAFLNLQFGFVIFCQKNIGLQAVRKMLLKLTTVVKIKKRPKDGTNKPNVGPNDLPIENSEEGDLDNGQNQQNSNGQNQGRQLINFRGYP